MSSFKTKARAIDLLGEKQIKDEATAISELFKNAHDADATDVELAIETRAKALVLWDNGHGMSADDVETKWLTVGTDSKLSSTGTPKRSKQGRVMMGEKGIGRLAVATLGSQALMITKTAGGPYVLAYLHWDVFTNGELFLEDTIVPVRLLEDISALGRVLEELKADQRLNVGSSNPRVAAAWGAQYERLGTQILDDIAEFELHSELLGPLLDKIQEHGTLFYVTNLKEKWDTLSDPAQRGQRLKRKRESLSVMMSSFVNTIALFEGQTPQPNQTYAFSPRLRVDGHDLVSAVRFEEEDLHRYDYGLVGEIKGGKFFGHHLIHDKEPEEVTVELTQDLDIDDMADCGPFRVSVFFVEGEPKNTLLDLDDHKTITDKLEKIGGIYVYRDGLRVLPYGTPEHDFLEIEKRRTLKAGRYVFSMRNLFGYVAISKEANPGLEDKSSREGIRETAEYDYFRSVLIRLMIWWGKEFLNSEGRREEERERKKKERELRDLEKRRQEERQRYLDALTAADSERRDAVNRQAGELAGQVRKLIPLPHELGAERDLINNYTQLWSYLESLDSTRRSIAQHINSVGSVADLPFRPQFANDFEATSIRESYADFVRSYQQKLNDELNQRWSAAREYLQGELYLYLDRVAEQVGTPYAETFVRGLQSAVQHAVDEVDAAQTHALERLQEAIAQKAMRYQGQLAELTGLVNRGQMAAETEGVQRMLRSFESVRAEADTVQGLLQAFTRLERSTDLKAMAADIQRRTADIGDRLASVEAGVDGNLRSVLDGFSVSALDILGKTMDRTIVEDERRYLELLEETAKDQQDELHAQRGLAMTGLAAEVLNHEFEVTYGLIRSKLEQPSVRAVLEDVPDLRAVYELLAHVQERYRQMKPMYRKARTYRRVLLLRDAVDQVVGLFSSVMASNRITVENWVDETFSIYESETVLFPVLVNLFNNAMHWMITRSDRTLLIRSDVSTGSLYVEDSGIGVSPENAERVFDLFYTTKLDGRGIGLHLVQKLLTDRKHSISCVTDPTEKMLTGACFRIDFDRTSVRVG